MTRRLVVTLLGALLAILCDQQDQTSKAAVPPDTTAMPSPTADSAVVPDSTASTATARKQDRTRKTARKSRLLQCALNNGRFNPRKWLEEDHTFPPPGPPGKISRFDPIIRKMARRYGFDWRLIAAQIYAESGFDSTAKSHCGARGLMQVMPKTASHLGANPVELEKPEVNVATGCLYDRRMVTLWKRNVDNREERLAFALASYNAGRGRVLRSFSSEDSLTEWKKVHPLLPDETQDYVHRIALKYDFYSRYALP
jgi:soluble lytic murein transglycosylase-like protein